MKHIILALAVAGMALPALAKDRSYDESRRMEQDQYAKAEVIFQRLDKDDNGILNVREQQALGEKLYRIDRNRDDMITLAELSHDYTVNSAENWRDWGYEADAANEKRNIIQK